MIQEALSRNQMKSISCQDEAILPHWEKEWTRLTSQDDSNEIGHSSNSEIRIGSMVTSSNNEYTNPSVSRKRQAKMYY